MFSHELNERLLISVHGCDFEGVLSCLLEGASATYVSVACGRTAVGTAALVGDIQILDMLLQFCEDPELDIFRQARAKNSTEIETTPDDMENLEWEDEFDVGNESENVGNSFGDPGGTEVQISLYYYYAKTFERTGELLTKFQAGDTNAYCQTGSQDPHSVDAEMMSPLHYAAGWGNLACAQRLLEHGAPIDVFNSDGYTPLHLAMDNADISRLLIKHGANPNLKTISGGQTALHLAIQDRHATVAQIVLQTNIDINSTDANERTPLICAAATGMDVLARTLIERGARINLQDADGYTALYYAVVQNNAPLTKLLLSRGARRITVHHLLHHCVTNGLLRMVALLLDYGDCLSVRNSDGYTPILCAINCGNAEMLELLLHVATDQSRQQRYSEPLDNELLEAVQRLTTLTEFRKIARILFSYSESCRRNLYNNGHQLLCYASNCQTPLSRAINLQKLDIAAFLLMEGCSILQICREHVVNSLRAMSSPSRMAFGSLLVNAGFNFPYKRTPAFPDQWTPQRVCFELHMRELSTNPLSLQSLTRLVIRQRLLFKLQSSREIQAKYRNTATKSSLMIMVEKLDVPLALKTFLTNFDELPKVL